MAEKRDADYRKEIKVTVHNDFIKADYPQKMTVADLKLLRLAIAQCKKNDQEFYEYTFNARDVADLFKMNRANLYREGLKVAKKLFKVDLQIGSEKEGELIHIFRKCKYKDGVFTMLLDDEAKDLFLNLKSNFTNIPLEHIVLMKNKNSIRIYEVIRQKMMNHFPRADVYTVIEITAEEIREVTETVDKKSYNHVGHLKDRLLLPALAEIESATNWKIVCKDLKRGRKVFGFELEIWSSTGYAYIEMCKAEGKIPQIARDDQIPGQMSLFD